MFSIPAYVGHLAFSISFLIVQITTALAETRSPAPAEQTIQQLKEIEERLARDPPPSSLEAPEEACVVKLQVDATETAALDDLSDQGCLLAIFIHAYNRSLQDGRRLLFNRLSYTKDSAIPTLLSDPVGRLLSTFRRTGATDGEDPLVVRCTASLFQFPGAPLADLRQLKTRTEFAAFSATAKGYVLTNRHCVQRDGWVLEKLSFRVFYYLLDSGLSVDLVLPVLEIGTASDYAIASVAEADMKGVFGKLPSLKFTYWSNVQKVIPGVTVPFDTPGMSASTVQVLPFVRATLIGHPMGLPQMVSEAGCVVDAGGMSPIKYLTPLQIPEDFRSLLHFPPLMPDDWPVRTLLSSDEKQSADRDVTYAYTLDVAPKTAASINNVIKSLFENGKTLRHTCPTIGASSGSPIFDSKGSFVGLHAKEDDFESVITLGWNQYEADAVEADQPAEEPSSVEKPPTEINTGVTTGRVSWTGTGPSIREMAEESETLRKAILFQNFGCFPYRALRFPGERVPTFFLGSPEGREADMLEKFLDWPHPTGDVGSARSMGMFRTASIEKITGRPNYRYADVTDLYPDPKFVEETAQALAKQAKSDLGAANHIHVYVTVPACIGSKYGRFSVAGSRAKLAANLLAKRLGEIFDPEDIGDVTIDPRVIEIEESRRNGSFKLDFAEEFDAAGLDAGLAFVLTDAEDNEAFEFYKSE